MLRSAVQMCSSCGYLADVNCKCMVRPIEGDVFECTDISHTVVADLCKCCKGKKCICCKTSQKWYEGSCIHFGCPCCGGFGCKCCDCNSTEYYFTTCTCDGARHRQMRVRKIKEDSRITVIPSGMAVWNGGREQMTEGVVMMKPALPDDYEPISRSGAYCKEPYMAYDLDHSKSITLPSGRDIMVYPDILSMITICDRFLRMDALAQKIRRYIHCALEEDPEIKGDILAEHIIMYNVFLDTVIHLQEIVEATTSYHHGFAHMDEADQGFFREYVLRDDVHEFLVNKKPKNTKKAGRLSKINTTCPFSGWMHPEKKHDPTLDILLVDRSRDFNVARESMSSISQLCDQARLDMDKKTRKAKVTFAQSCDRVCKSKPIAIPGKQDGIKTDPEDMDI